MRSGTVVLALLIAACGSSSSGSSSGHPTPNSKQVTLKLTTSGNGLIRGTGSDCRSSCSVQYPAGAQVHLTAVPDAQSTFSGWAGACSGMGACDVTLETDQEVAASFSALPVPAGVQVHLVASVSGPGTVTGGGLNCGESTSTCDVTVVSGSTVTLTATPAGGTRFTGWGGACSGTATTCQLATNADTNVTAEFESEVMALAPNDGTNTGTIALNATRLFWQRYTNGTAIWSVPKKGGDAVRIVAASTSAIVADDSYVYWTDQYSVYSVPVQGGQVAQLASAYPIGRLALDETGALYWTVGPTPDNSGTVHRTQSRVDTVIASGQNPMGAIAVDADYVYFSNADSSLRRVPRNGGAVEKMISCTAGCLYSALRADSENVYLREMGRNVGSVFVLSKKDHSLRVISGAYNGPGFYGADLDVNASVAYWNWTGGSGPYGIYRASVDGSGLAAFDTSNEMTWGGPRVDDEAVYYWHAGAIIRRLK